MRTLSALLLLAVLANTIAGALAAERPKGPDALTVIGAIPQSNRPVSDTASDSFPAFHGKEPHRIFAFDHAALAALPQVRIEAAAETWWRGVVARGPRLRDVLQAAGVPPRARIELITLDGFSLVLTPADRAARDWVLATEVDGRALGFGEYGPSWLLHDTGGKAASAAEEATWLWSVFMIQVPDWAIEDR